MTDEESIAFGKLCGCNRCRYCYDWQHERLMQRMEDEVRRGKEIAEDARKEWLDKHINRS